jgi:hypothetical protein
LSAVHCGEETHTIHDHSYALTVLETADQSGCTHDSLLFV